jgi:hypothetical protein
MNKIRIHSKPYLYAVVAAVVIGAALLTTEGVGANLGPDLARLARIKDAAYPVAAGSSGS